MGHLQYQGTLCIVSISYSSGDTAGNFPLSVSKKEGLRHLPGSREDSKDPPGVSSTLITTISHPVSWCNGFGTGSVLDNDNLVVLMTALVITGGNDTAHTVNTSYIQLCNKLKLELIEMKTQLLTCTRYVSSAQ